MLAKYCIIIFIVTANILAQSSSRVELRSFESTILNTSKSFNIYLPRGYDESNRHYSVVYFLRLHESEWFNPGLSGRSGSTLKDVADSLIEGNYVSEMILVGPNTGSDNGNIAGLVNMFSPNLTISPGIGTGRFEDYLIHDLIPYIDSNYRTIPNKENRGIDGFSLGGYTAVLLSLRNPNTFSSVGSYDGTFMWYNLDDPKIEGDSPDDPVWLNTNLDLIFGPLFGIPRNIDYMLQNSSVNILSEADNSKLDSIKSIRFHIHTGPRDTVANFGRNKQLLDTMAAKGIFNTFSNFVLSPDAVHTFGFADLHASKSLIKHWETFQNVTSVRNEQNSILTEMRLFQNYPNPFNSETKITANIKKEGHISLVIYDVLGAKVKILHNSYLSTGTKVFSWNGLNDNNFEVSGGVYVLTLQTNDEILTKKILLLK